MVETLNDYCHPCGTDTLEATTLVGGESADRCEVCGWTWRHSQGKVASDE